MTITNDYFLHNSKNHLYQVWSDIKRRCYCESDSHYERYGKRGITMCSEWLLDFDNFARWCLSHGYTKDDSKSLGDRCSIDKIDVNGNYEPSNCQIISVRENAGKDKVGKKIPKEVNEKHSKSILGKKNHFFGKHHSDKTKELLSKKNSGKNLRYIICMYDLEGNLLETFKGFNEVKSYFINKFNKKVCESSIRQSAKGMYGRTQSYGYKWGYKLCE